MRKSFKKGIAMVLATALALGTPIAVNDTSANAAGIEVPEPAYMFDFEGDDALQNKGTVSGGVVEAVQSANGTVAVSGGALYVSSNSVDTWGENYAKLPEELFSGVTVEDGMTISMDVLVTADKNFDWSVLFSSTPETYNSWGLFKFNANLNMACNIGDPQIWDAGSPTTIAHYGKWTNVTITVKGESMIMYIDGIQSAVVGTADASPGAAQGMAPLLNAIKNNAFNVLGAGGFPGDGKTGDKDISDVYYDNIQVFNTALDGSQVYKVATGEDAKVDALISDLTAVIDGNSVEVSYTEDVAPTAVTATVNDKVVATEGAITVTEGVANFSYVPEDGANVIKVTASKEVSVDGVYLDDTETVTVNVKKVDGTLLYDYDLFTAFGATSVKGGYNIGWETVDGATYSAVVKGADEKVVTTLTAPGLVSTKDLKEGTYTVTLSATKAGYVSKTATTTFEVISDDVKPVISYVFDGNDKNLELKGAVSVKDGRLVFGKTDGNNNDYAKIADTKGMDFSKGVTVAMDVKPDEYVSDWTNLIVIGDNSKLDLAAADASYLWRLTLGFTSIGGDKTDYNGAGYFGNGVSAPYTWDYFNTEANRGKWYSMAVTITPTTMTTYVNGQQVQTGTGDYTKALKAFEVGNMNFLGTSYWNADADFVGSMDNVGIYNVALSADAIDKMSTGEKVEVGPPNTGGTTPNPGTSKKTMMIKSISAKVGGKKISGEVNASNATVEIKVGKGAWKKATVTGKKFSLKVAKLKIGTKITVKASAEGYTTAEQSKTLKGTMKLSAVKAKKGSKKITGKISVKKATVQVKVGKAKFKKAKVTGKKFTFKTKKLKKGTKIKIKVTKKNYKTVNKTVKVK